MSLRKIIIATRDLLKIPLKDQISKTIVSVDGAYYFEEISKKAKSKDIKMVPTTLVSRNQKVIMRNLR